MPVALRVDGFTVRIRTGDHGPPHVHVFLSGDEVVINLGDRLNIAHIRDFRGMSRRHARRALDIVVLNQEHLMKEWLKIYP